MPLRPCVCDETRRGSACRAGFDAFLTEYGLVAALGATLALAAGGFAKGVVGFALPLIAVSVLGSFVPYQVAVALLDRADAGLEPLPGLRNGLGPALGSLRDFWWLNLVLMVMIALSAQLVVALPDRAALRASSASRCRAFGATQLAGWRPRFRAGTRPGSRPPSRWSAASSAASPGIWGPPIVMYLVAADLPKAEMIRAQSLSFLLGSLVLFGAHLHSGVLNAVTLPASAWLVAADDGGDVRRLPGPRPARPGPLPHGHAGGPGADRPQPRSAARSP